MRTTVSFESFRLNEQKVLLPKSICSLLYKSDDKNEFVSFSTDTNGWRNAHNDVQLVRGYSAK